MVLLHLVPDGARKVPSALVLLCVCAESLCLVPGGGARQPAQEVLDLQLRSFEHGQQ